MKNLNLIIVYLFISVLTLFFQYQIQFFGYTFYSGVFVNDAQSYWQHLDDIAKYGIESGNYFTMIGVVYLYIPSIIIGPLYCYIINSILILFSFIYFIKSVNIINPLLITNKIFLFFLLFITNLYLLELLFSPNKEIPLIFLTNLFIYFYVLKRRLLIGLFLIILMFFFRDGHALILLSSSILLYIFRNRIYNSFLFFLFFMIIFMMFFSLKALSSYGILGDYTYILSRNVDLESEGKFGLDLPYFIQYIINLFNNTLGYSIRNQLFDSHYRLFFYGIGLWQISVLIVLAIFSWIKVVSIESNKNLISIAFLFFSNIIFLSSSSFPQPRYMLPMIFWIIFLVTRSFNFNKIKYTFFFFFLIASILIFSGFSFELADGIDIDINQQTNK